MDFLDDIINSHVGGRKMPAICKLSFFRISMSQQTSATTCKAHDFYYSIKIRQMPGISVDIMSFFSRLAAEQKGPEVEEEFFDADGQESRALEREALLQELVDETQREIDLQHPTTFKNFNLCLLLSNKRLSDALKKLKLCDLREMQEGLNVESNGPSSRKATYIEPLVNLVKCCSCCH